MTSRLLLSRRGQIQPFIAMDMLKSAQTLAGEGREIIHLEVGQPSTGAPETVLKSAETLLRGNNLGYTEALGWLPLRRRIAQHYQDRYGATVAPEQIVMTMGASGAFLLSYLACFDAGDRLVLPSPCYPAYRNVAHALDLSVVELPLGPHNHFALDLRELARLPEPVAGLVIGSPANPTGTMQTSAQLAEIATFARERHMQLIIDEIYHGLSYTGPARTMLEFTPEAIVINSFSKYFSMTGWRLGWLVAPPHLIKTIERLMQNLFIAAPSLAQFAALAAFDATEELEGNVARYRRNRDHLLGALPPLGFGPIAPADGAFYLYAGIKHFGENSATFCRRLLVETGISITPGIDFDPCNGADFVRISYAGSEQDITKAIAILQNTQL